MTGSDDKRKDGGPPTEWDAASYHRLPAPQFAWGVQVLERLRLNGDETVMDAGGGGKANANRDASATERARTKEVDGRLARMIQLLCGPRRRPELSSARRLQRKGLSYLKRRETDEPPSARPVVAPL
jgi:hypothetical protein